MLGDIQSDAASGSLWTVQIAMKPVLGKQPMPTWGEFSAECEEVLMTGSLWTKSWIRAGAKKRFFVLVGPKNASLRRYKKEKDFKANLPFAKVYDLGGSSISCPGRGTENAKGFGIFHPVRGQVRIHTYCPPPPPSLSLSLSLSLSFSFLLDRKRR